MLTSVSIQLVFFTTQGSAYEVMVPTSWVKLFISINNPDKSKGQLDMDSHFIESPF